MSADTIRQTTCRQVATCALAMWNFRSPEDAFLLPTLELHVNQSDGYYVANKPITLSCILFMFIENEIYSLSFLCDVCYEVHEHVQ